MPIDVLKHGSAFLKRLAGNGMDMPCATAFMIYVLAHVLALTFEHCRMSMQGADAGWGVSVLHFVWHATMHERVVPGGV